MDTGVQKVEAANKFWDTHDFNHVSGQYYDPIKEKQYVNQRQEAAKIHGKDQIDRLPVSVKK